jgi:hypothetical protein
MKVKIGTESAQFLFWKFINRGFRSSVTDPRPSLLALAINPVKSSVASDGIVQGQFKVWGQSVNPLNFVFLNIAPDLILVLSLHHTLYTAFLKGCC